MTESKDSKINSLFQGQQFWLSQNVPQRSRFKELITVCMHPALYIQAVDSTRLNLA